MKIYHLFSHFAGLYLAASLLSCTPKPIKQEMSISDPKNALFIPWGDGQGQLPLLTVTSPGYAEQFEPSHTPEFPALRVAGDGSSMALNFYNGQYIPKSELNWFRHSTGNVKLESAHAVYPFSDENPVLETSFFVDSEMNLILLEKVAEAESGSYSRLAYFDANGLVKWKHDHLEGGAAKKILVAEDGNYWLLRHGANGKNEVSGLNDAGKIGSQRIIMAGTASGMNVNLGATFLAKLTEREDPTRVRTPGSHKQALIFAFAMDRSLNYYSKLENEILKVSYQGEIQEKFTFEEQLEFNPDEEKKSGLVERTQTVKNLFADMDGNILIPVVNSKGVYIKRISRN